MQYPSYIFSFAAIICMWYKDHKRWVDSIWSSSEFQAVKKQSLCSLLKIVQEKANGWPRVLDIYFENNDTTAYTFEEAITIEETGMYYLWFVTCDEDLSSATVRGQTTWKNPTGKPRYPSSRIIV